MGVGLGISQFERGAIPLVFEIPVAVGKGIANAVADSRIGSRVVGMAKAAIDTHHAQRRQDGINAWLKAEHIMPQSTI